MALSSFEETKRHLDPYASRDRVFARVAGGQGKEIAPDDDIVMRWHGLYAQRPAGSGLYMLRLKLPGGAIAAGQAIVAAELTERIGDGSISLTTRQGIELHGVPPARFPEAFAALDAAGLTTSGACGDQVRSVIACPVAGIDAGEVADTTQLAEALTAAFLGNPSFANLPRKFKIALSGCACGCVPYDVNDVGLVAIQTGQGPNAYALLLGGGLSVQPTYAAKTGLLVREEEAVEVVTRLVEIFRDHGNREQRGRARVKHLLAERGLDWLLGELQCRLGRALAPHGGSILSPARRDHLGIHRQHEDGKVYLGIPVPGGALTGTQLRELAGIARECGRGRLRLTHLQNVILPDLDAGRIEEVRGRLTAANLPFEADSPYGRAVACVGKTFCTRALANTRECLRMIVGTTGDPLLGTAISLRLSGCPNGCGGHAMADIGLRGAAVKIDGKTEERFDLYLGGGEVSGTPAFAKRYLARQRPDELAGAVAGLLQRYRTDANRGETFSSYVQRVLLPTTAAE